MPDPRYTRLIISPVIDSLTINNNIYIYISSGNTDNKITEFNIYQYSSCTIKNYGCYAWGGVEANRTQQFLINPLGCSSPKITGKLDAVSQSMPTDIFTFNKYTDENSNVISNIEHHNSINTLINTYNVEYDFDVEFNKMPLVFYIQIKHFNDKLLQNIYIYFQAIKDSLDEKAQVQSFMIIGFGDSSAIPQIQKYVNPTSLKFKYPLYDTENQQIITQGFATSTQNQMPLLQCLIPTSIISNQPIGTNKYYFSCINKDSQTFQQGYIYFLNEQEENLGSEIEVDYCFQTTDPSCFSEGTKILCYKQLENSLIYIFKEEYRLVQDLKVGDLVKSYKHGYRRISKILSGFFINNPNGRDNGDCMYKMSKTEDNGLIEDLVLTRNHAILVEKLTKNEKKATENDEMIIIDDLLCLITGKSDKFEKVQNTNFYNYYHFSLDSDGDNDRRFGVWANGLLVELPSNNMMDNVLKTNILDF
jgi:hypothetical protein